MDPYDEKPWLPLQPEPRPTEAEPEWPSILHAFLLADADPGAPQLKYFDRTLSHGEVDELSAAIGAALVDSGVRLGDRVALYLQNVPQYVIALLAIWRIGAVAVAVSPMLKSQELQMVLTDSGAVGMVALDDIYDSYARPLMGDGDMRLVITTSALDYQSRDDRRVLAFPDRAQARGACDFVALTARYRGRKVETLLPDSDDAAVLTYTSGTTGTPKAAIITHRNIIVGAQTYRDWWRLGESDSVLGIAPLFHVTGLTGHIGVALLTGIPLVLHYRFDLGVVLDAIAEHQPSFTVGASTIFAAMLNDPDIPDNALASIRVIASGGAPIPPILVTRFRQRFGLYIHNVYGLTETSSPTHAVPLGNAAPVDAKSGTLSIGIPVWGSQAWVVDDQGRPVPVGEIGELLVAGPRISPGYWNRPQVTSDAFDDGRFRTGDLAMMDSAGWFYLVDRKKDMIIASGFKVYPREVEDVLYGHAAIREAAVVGIPDDYRGETVKAFVSLLPGHQTDAAEIIAYCRERMAAYKYPRVVEILDELPKTITGKILRRELRG